MRLMRDTDVIKAVDRHTMEDGTLDEDITVILEEVRTAFDKEKVIEELKSAIGDIHYTEDGSFNGKCIEDFEFIQAKTALEIVEKGGIG